MNPVKLKFRHGGEMLVSPIGLRFVEDPDHGPLVLIPEVQGPRGYQLDMTVEEAEQAFRSDQTQVDALAKKVYWLQEQLEALARRYSRYESLDAEFLAGNAARWQALAIHLGLPEGWEHLHELAAETKGALVSQAEEINALRKEAKESWELRSQIQDELRDLIMGRVERLEQGMIDRVGGLERLTGCLCTYGMTERKANEIDSVKAHVDALYSELGLNSRWEGERLVSYRDTDSILTEVVLMQREVSRLTEEASLFTVAERVGELEEAQRRLRQRTENLESWKREVHPDLAQDRAFPLLDDRTCVQRQVDWTGEKPREWHEGWVVGHRVGMSDQQYLDPLEKPKSAWRPLSEVVFCGWYFIRDRRFHRLDRIEVACFGVDRLWMDRFEKPLQIGSHHEFCPIPE